MSKNPPLGKRDKVKALFQKYDTNGDGILSRDELDTILSALGVDGSKCDGFFQHIDENHDGVIQYDEFLNWVYEDQGDYAPGSTLISNSLAETFYAFCGPDHRDLDGKTFAKLCKDAGLLDAKFTATDVDLIFAKCVVKGQRRIGYSQFERALSEIAGRRGSGLEDIRAMVAVVKTPTLHGTAAGAVRFHDDKSTYTGVHQHGGPEAVAKGHGHLPAAGMELRSSSKPQHADADPHPPPMPPADRTPLQPVPPNVPSPGRPNVKVGAGARATSPGRTGPVKLPEIPPMRREPTWAETFAAYCGAHPSIDGKTFVKLLKDASLVDKKFTSTDADLVFAKSVSKGERRLTEVQFGRAIEQVAERRREPLEDVQYSIGAMAGPVLHGTVADSVRFHDDKRTYTGTHVHGGPESVRRGTGTSTQLASRGMGSGF